MFGINKLKNDIAQLTYVIECMHNCVDGNTKELHHYADRGASILKLCQDTKLDISTLKMKMADIESRLIHIEKLYTANATINLKTLNEIEHEEIKRTALIKGLGERQDNLLEYLKSIEINLIGIDSALEHCKPIAKIPKLPKTKKATTEHS